jgi:hypothetical protein
LPFGRRSKAEEQGRKVRRHYFDEFSSVLHFVPPPLLRYKKGQVTEVFVKSFKFMVCDLLVT